jgi:hypothetical protein
MLRQAGVKEAFYRTLAEGVAMGQVIVFENEDPPSDLSEIHHHFSKSPSGRYGFVPVQEPDSDAQEHLTKPGLTGRVLLGPLNVPAPCSKHVLLFTPDELLSGLAG